MPRTWMQADADCLEAIDASEEARALVLRIGRLVHTGRLEEFRALVAEDRQLDAGTRAWVLEVAANEAFLLAAELHLSRSLDCN
jgi:hypothetical protein